MEEVSPECSSFHTVHRKLKQTVFQQGKADSTFLYPKTSPSSSHAAPDFPICPIAQEIGLNNLGTSRQVAITQVRENTLKKFFFNFL